MANAAGVIGSSISSLIQEYHTIAHNMANINTTGYKRKVNAFSRELAELTGGGGDPTMPASEVKATGSVDLSQGSLLTTGRSLDVAINGKGFFVIETENGPLYSRNGVFQVSNSGQLVDLDGRLVAGEAGPIVVPPGISAQQITISEAGQIKAGQVGIGKLRVVDFGEDEGQLVNVGDNCFKAPGDLSPKPGTSVLEQGYRENSNVKLVEELINLITVSRLYETNMNLLRKRHENAKTMLGVTNS